MMEIWQAGLFAMAVSGGLILLMIAGAMGNPTGSSTTDGAAKLAAAVFIIGGLVAIGDALRLLIL